MTHAERSCVICRKKGAKQSFFRFVLQEGRVILDLAQIASSRGAYVHRSMSCVERVSEVGRWEKAFRVKKGQLSGVLRELAELKQQLRKQIGVVEEEQVGGKSLRTSGKSPRVRL